MVYIELQFLDMTLSKGENTIVYYFTGWLNKRTIPEITQVTAKLYYLINE
jgi:hypothetical protein